MVINMTNLHGHCVCGAVEIVIKEYGDFVYTCHCDTCRRMNSGPVLSVDPGTKENVLFTKGQDKITVYHDEEIERGFCSVCGSNLYWYNPADTHYCMNAELFDEIIKNASFNLELFYDMKPDYYSFVGERKRLDRNYQEI
ncbi:MAG: GFA family protein [Oscillospiraceae bacterium]